MFSAALRVQDSPEQFPHSMHFNAIAGVARKLVSSLMLVSTAISLTFTYLTEGLKIGFSFFFLKWTLGLVSNWSLKLH